MKKMKKRWMFVIISVLSIFVLASCGSGKYDKSIDSVFSLEKDKNVWNNEERGQINRSKSEVWVFNDGKYIEIDFPGKDYKNKPITYKRYFKLNSKDEYETANFDTETYIKEDAKLVYHEKNGEQIK